MASDHPTGRCAVLITGQERSLVTKLDAANQFSVAHLEESTNWEVVEEARVIYSAGFLLTVSPEAMLKVGRFCAATDRNFCFNLSAAFIIKFFKEQIMSVMPYADIVFGNETEAAMFAEIFNLGSVDLNVIAIAISKQPKANMSTNRIVVITQGSAPVIFVENGQACEFPIEKVPAESIVDTNSAGDAFVGGFLAQFAQGRGVEASLRCGAWAAARLIQRPGCTLPEVMDFRE